MARTSKKGLSYFPLDVDFFDDDKIQLINAEYGVYGENAALRILCHIYRNGYWYKMGGDECLLLAKRMGHGVTGSRVIEIVSGLVRRSFFDKVIFDKYEILTSKGIQARYFEAAERRKTIEVIPEIMLIDVNDNIKAQNVNINPLNVNTGTQKKRKEKKRKESNGTEIDGLRFDDFWNLYDKKVGDKDKLKKKWDELPEEEKRKAINHVPFYKFATPDKKYRKNPETYLNNKSWHDEVIHTTPIQPAAALKEPELKHYYSVQEYEEEMRIYRKKLEQTKHT